MESNAENIYFRIKIKARQQGLSLPQLAIKAGIGEKSIYRWKKIMPSIDSLMKVANVLNVPVSVLINGTEESKDEINIKKADLSDDSTLFTFQGKEIPKSDLEIIRRLLKGGNE
ncbi:helix-turn-helix transcriptional regulator [Lactobacillus mulieris]|uniref:Helix-turn-helix transcriptional regulator n=1 Tax=Lactobacillus jensenii TaxID=109790 RepID=A0ABU9FFL4_LACJE|nr:MULTISPECIES: helix-turn-helix transcriptional regulator [Lactobacillus]MCW8072795.1 helix-turn-helix domain-containing protein [Lactobacillus mulieris]MDK6268393.1 helix-turn-helix transcriptional regulator [Lactobacillus mulieris]MDT9545030.1 helix-turn-helix transcriptional regulator [Lactobacillus jensenii]